MKVIYPATIEKIDDQYWLEFPDLEGCQTWGDSIETGCRCVLPAT